jgi:hypothetical protein
LKGSLVDSKGGACLGKGRGNICQGHQGQGGVSFHNVHVDWQSGRIVSDEQDSKECNSLLAAFVFVAISKPFRDSRQLSNCPSVVVGM